MSDSFDYIKKNYLELCDEIEYLAARSGVIPPRIVAVTKSGSDSQLSALFSAGAYAMGENRPGELRRRCDLLRSEGKNPEIHQIGTLQSNKVKLICDRVTLIHSLDKISLAKEISRRAAECGRVIPVLIEINSGREEQKGGVFPEGAMEFYEEAAELPGIKISGLMTMGPVAEGEEIRKYFRLTRELFDNMNSRYGFGEGATLSMGMSDSYKIAIEEGSTLVRIGRRLFKK